MKRLPIVDAVENPALLGFKLWPRQRDRLEEVEQGPRLHVWALGRRSGKTTMGALVGLHACLFRPDLDELVRPGERRYIVAVATRLEQARLFVDAARSIVESAPLIAEQVETVGDDEIRFRNGTSLLALPCTSRGIRGLAISTAIMDEAAWFLDTDGNAAAEPVFRALVPSTAQFGDLSRVIVASTPYGVDGFFADLYERVRDGGLDDAVAVSASTAEMNPTISPRFLERELARDPDGFRGEYLADFVGSGGSYIDADRLAEAVGNAGELDRLDAIDWIVGLDLGFASDPTACVLVGRFSGAPERLRVGLARTWAPQRGASFDERRAIEDRVLADVAEIADYFGARVVSDQMLAPVVRDFFERRGIAIETSSLSAETKSLSFSELRGRIYEGAIELLDHPDLLRELRGLRAQFRAGKSSVVTPRTSRGHSDLAVALALATWEHARGGSSAHGSVAVSSSEFDDRYAPSRMLDRIGRIDELTKLSVEGGVDSRPPGWPT